MKEGGAELERGEHGGLGVAKEAEGCAIAGIEDDAVDFRNIANGLGEVLVKTLLPSHLELDGLLGITDDVHEDDAA